MRPQHLMDRAAAVGASGKPPLELPGRCFARGIAVRDRNAPKGAARPDEVDGAPVGEHRYGQPRDGGERRFVVERRRQRGARLRQKSEGLLDLAALRDVDHRQDARRHVPPGVGHGPRLEVQHGAPAVGANGLYVLPRNLPRPEHPRQGMIRGVNRRPIQTPEVERGQRLRGKVRRRRPPEQPFQLRVGHDELAPVGGADHEADRQLLHDRREVGPLTLHRGHELEPFGRERAGLNGVLLRARRLFLRAGRFLLGLGRGFFR